MEFDIRVFFDNTSRILKLHYNTTRITGALHEVRCSYTISRRILLVMRNVSDGSSIDNQNIHFVFSNFFSKIVQSKR
jgi:hypothetical protein